MTKRTLTGFVCSVSGALVLVFAMGVLVGRAHPTHHFVLAQDHVDAAFDTVTLESQ